MKFSSIWAFIADNIIGLSTVVFGLLVILLTQLNILPDSVILPMILAVLALLATSEMIESRKKLATLEEKLDEINRRLAESGQSVKITVFDSQGDAQVYIGKRLLEARRSIDQASIDRLRSVNSPNRDKFRRDRWKVIQDDRVKYRYIGVLYTRRRLDLIYKAVIENRARNFFAGYYSKPIDDIPLISFTVIDKSEVFTRYPFELGQDTGYISIQSPVVAALFTGYFERIWEHSRKVRSLDDYHEIENSLDSSQTIVEE